MKPPTVAGQGWGGRQFTPPWINVMMSGADKMKKTRQAKGIKKNRGEGNANIKSNNKILKSPQKEFREQCEAHFGLLVPISCNYQCAFLLHIPFVSWIIQQNI